MNPFLELRALGLRHPEDEIAAGRNHREDREHPVNEQEREQ